MTIRPISYKEASEYINKYHRHHNAPQGMKWAVAVYDGDILHGVATAGRPVSRMIDDGMTCEITRVCTDGTRNACSMLYGACQRIARDMGYKRVITYTLESEDGSSVKAANFRYDGDSGGGSWSRASRKRCDDDRHIEQKKRWVRDL